MVFVNQSVEALLAQHRSCAGPGRRHRRAKVKAKMGSLLVVVIHVLPEDHLQGALAEDEQPVQVWGSNITSRWIARRRERVKA
jgi:hypothetical protein